MASTVSFVRIAGGERDGRARFALLLGMVVVFAVYRAACVGFGEPAALALAIAFDSSAWGLCWLLSEAVASSRAKWREWAAGALFYPMMYLSAGMVFAHTWFLEAALSPRLTVFDLTLSGIAEFFGDALSLKGYVALILVLLGSHLVAYVAAINFRRPNLAQGTMVVLPALLLTGLASAALPETPSVLYDSVRALYRPAHAR